MHDQPLALEIGAAVPDSSDVRDYWVLLKPNVMSLVVFSAAAGLYLAPGTLHPLLMAVATSALTVAQSVGATAVVLFALGLGWNFSFVSATAELADGTHAGERGKLLGLNDLLSGGTGAGLALAGGLTLSEFGVTQLAVGATALVVVPAIWIAAVPARHAAPAER